MCVSCSNIFFVIYRAVFDSAVHVVNDPLSTVSLQPAVDSSDNKKVLPLLVYSRLSIIKGQIIKFVV